MKEKKPAKASASKAIVAWDEELAKQADVASAMEANAGGGQFFGLRGGQLTWQDAPLKDNQMAVIILDSILETVYYEGAYNPDIPQSPVAFAFGRDEKTMRWHENSAPEFAGQLCSESDVCQWGSADIGRGKAARETRRLGMIPAGYFNAQGKFEMIEDEDHYESTTVGFMKLPVTSVKGYASFVKQISETLRRPPFGIIAKVKVVPDPKSQFRVLFEPIMNVPNELLEVVMKRHKEVSAMIDFPYQPMEDEPAPPPRRGAQRPAPSRGAQKPGKAAPVKRGRY